MAPAPTALLSSPTPELPMSRTSKASTTSSTSRTPTIRYWTVSRTTESRGSRSRARVLNPPRAVRRTPVSRPAGSAVAGAGPGAGVDPGHQQSRAGQGGGHHGEDGAGAAHRQQQRRQRRAAEDADALGPARGHVGRGQLVRGPGQDGQERVLGRAGDGDRGRGQRGQAVDQRDGGVGEQGGGGRGHRGRLGQVAAEQDPLAPEAVPGDRGQGRDQRRRDQLDERHQPGRGRPADLVGEGQDRHPGRPLGDVEADDRPARPGAAPGCRTQPGRRRPGGRGR